MRTNPREEYQSAAISAQGLRDVGQMRVFARLAVGLALPARFFAPPPAFAPYQMEHSSYHLFHSQFLKHFVRNCPTLPKERKNWTWEQHLKVKQDKPTGSPFLGMMMLLGMMVAHTIKKP